MAYVTTTVADVVVEGIAWQVYEGEGYVKLLFRAEGGLLPAVVRWNGGAAPVKGRAYRVVGYLRLTKRGPVVIGERLEACDGVGNVASDSR